MLTLTEEDIQAIRNLIAQSKGPDRTGSGLSRKSLGDAFRKDNLRNPRRLDTHYVTLDVIFAVDDLIALNPYSAITGIGGYNDLPSPLGLAPDGTEFIACEPGTIECLALVTQPTKDIPSLFVEIFVNGTSVGSATVSVTGGTPVLISFNQNYGAGDRIAVAVTNTGPLDVAEVFLEATLLRKERFVSIGA